MNHPAPRARALAALLVAAGALCATDAEAYCRSTTCTGDCPRDESGCKTTGAKLAWPSMCVGYSLQADGTVNLPMVQVRKVIAACFVTWSDLDCEGEPATLAFSELDDVGCHGTEYNEDSGNANVVLFQDTNWDYDSIENNLAKTTVTFDPDSGEIFDADIEINHAFNEFTVSDQSVVYDLQSVVTHEVGHFIGLDHSDLSEATMTPGYDDGTTELRTLDTDDIEAACEAYPPTRQVSCDPEPSNGLAYDCSTEGGEADGAGDAGGCAVGSTGASDAGGLAATASLLLGLTAAARRRRRRSGRKPTTVDEAAALRRGWE
ncbi:MAG: matrixin family metalloprotease [Polyangiaceae bacterium]